MKISACIITYNQVHYIEKCIKAAIDQKIENYEIVIGDDNSTDGTSEICKKYAESNPNIIRYFRRNKNLGMTRNWIATLEESKGNYIAICEGDDYWTDPLKLQKQVSFLENNKNYALHCTNALIIDGQKQTPTQNDAVSFNAFDILNKNFTYTASLCFKKEDILIPDFIEKSPAIDWLLILYALRKKKGYFSKNITCAYRIHEGGIWSQLEQENPTAIKKRFENLKKNALIYKCISKDNTFNNQVKKLAKDKQESYTYQAKRMTIIYPYLTLSSDDLMPKSLSSFVKLNLTKLKKAF